MMCCMLGIFLEDCVAYRYRPAASSAIQDWLLMEWNSELHVFAGLFDSTQAKPGERALRDA